MSAATANFLVEADALRRECAAGESLIVDVRKPSEYARGHIPGAVNVSTYDTFATDTRADGLKTFARDVTIAYLGVGISGMKPIAVYQEGTGMRAARETWILQYLGHPHVRMLHGGLTAWRAAGCDLSTETGGDWTVTFVAREQPGIAIGFEEIAGRLGQSNFTLLDVRDAEEYAGRDKTACCVRRGRIPGSVRIEWTEFLERGRFKPREAILALLRERGIDTEAEIVPYCHRGARSANAYYALRHAGLQRVRNYIGSWHEWSARTELPFEKG